MFYWNKNIYMKTCLTLLTIAFATTTVACQKNPQNIENTENQQELVQSEVAQKIEKLIESNQILQKEINELKEQNANNQVENNIDDDTSTVNSPEPDSAINSISIKNTSKILVSQSSSEGKTYADGHGGEVFFPLGDISFADEVISFEVGSPKPASPEYMVAENSLSIPNNASTSLGCTGTLIVRFKDNVLLDTEGSDLYIFEIGPDVEATNLSISADGVNWIDIGKISGARADIDISPFVEPGQFFSYVKLTDLKASCNSTYAGADIDAVGAIGAGLSLTLNDSVLFDFGKSILKPEAGIILNDFANKLANIDIKSIIVEGHTDNVGAQEYNQTLSENRAKAVQSYLNSLSSMKNIQIDVRGYGETRPLNLNETDEQRQQNRRVQLVVIGNN